MLYKYIYSVSTDHSLDEGGYINNDSLLNDKNID